MSRRPVLRLLSVVALLSIAIQPLAPAAAQQGTPTPTTAVAPNPSGLPKPETSPTAPVIAQSNVSAAPEPPAPGAALVEAISKGKWPAQLAASTGAIRPDVHGPQRTDPAEGIPTHAYSPFDERRNREYPCPPGGCEFVKGQVLVKLTPDVATRKSADRATAPIADAALSAALSTQGIASLEPIFPDAQPPKASAMAVAPDGEAVPLPDLTRWYRARLNDPSADVTAAAGSLSQTPGIALAEPDYLRKPVGDVKGSKLKVESRTFNLQPSTFSDPLYAQQWHLAATHVPEAWQWLSDHGLPPGGSRDIVVAVIDTGVDLTHPDLAANLWTNSREIPGNNIDDDGNGYRDDVRGADMITNSGNPLDDHGHGTHVAGIIAAQAGNGIGGVGVAYNTQIMAIKAAQYSGVLTSSDVAEGIYYAVAQGADVINMSFGGYARSQVEEDALTVAFGQAVLVAAAGNDAEANLPCRPGRDFYPAAYNWVLGVMAQRQFAKTNGDYLAEFSNYDCVAQDSHEYELMAPGVDVWSALPNDQYAAWAGTSMAAPVVSGLAALARTKWSDKGVYPSRFIMGQIATTGGLLQGYTPPGGSPISYYVPNAFLALTTVPQPKLSYLEHWTFDTAAQAVGNDNDGVVDAGETIDLAIVIRNQWGKADNVHVTLEAEAGVAGPDPYVTMVTGTVDYGAVGSFNIDDNGLIYDGQGAITGVRNPFRFTVDPNTPNDHVIPFRLTMVADNGYDPGAAPLTFVSRFYLIVQRGRELPRIISQDMTLTKGYYWLIPDATLIEAGVHVTVTEGTQVQFYSGDPNDPYHGNPNAYIQVEGSLVAWGTQNEPVEFFQWNVSPDLPVRFAGQQVRLSYTRLRNPIITVQSVEHSYFYQDSSSFLPEVSANSIAHSVFHEVGPNDTWRGVSIGNGIQNLYDSSNIRLTGDKSEDNVFLKNHKTGNQDAASWATVGPTIYKPQFIHIAFPVHYLGHTYAALQQYSTTSLSHQEYLDVAELFANQLGGHVVTIDDAAENQFLINYRNAYFNPTVFQQAYPNMNCCPNSTPCGCWGQFARSFFIGLTDREVDGQYRWLSSEPLNYTNWSPDQPGSGGNQAFVYLQDSGQWTDSSDLSGPVILELPGLDIDDADLEAIRQQIIAEGQFNTFKNNAILNAWWDTDINHWMRFDVGANRDYVRYLTNNFWGTTSTTLLDAAIQDYSDNFDRGLYDYLPMLTSAPTTTYPFVVDVTIAVSAQPAKSALNGPTPLVGAEPVTFAVTFNRDMDITIQPVVSFGPDTPMTDYTIHPINGGWTDARTWKGTFNITPVTGDGYQLIRVAGAVAADDPWLVTGDDAGRFRFEIITSGTESMNLQATGGEGRVNLAWTQNDFDLLAGFNLYRATTSGGPYSRINTSIIPPQTRAYTDTAVTPGIPYYYKFTVVKSGFEESDYSNVAQGTPLDTIPPTLTHTPVTSAAPGLALTLAADATDNVAVQAVTLSFRTIGGTAYTDRAMTRTTGNRYSATLEGSRITSPGIEYYIEATDGISTVGNGRREYPNQVVVSDKPTLTAVTPGRGPADGGTAVTVAGSNFKPGATVTFGGAAADDVTVVNSSQITCTTPAHYPAAADVVVTNPGGATGTLTRGFTFESATASLSLPATGGEQHAIVQIPINAANVQGLAAADIKVTFDPAVLSARGAHTGSLTPGWTVTPNTATVGEIRLAMASPGGTVTGAGTLALLEFEAIGAAGSSSPLTLASASLNAGAIPADLAAGSFAVANAYSIVGMVRFWQGSSAVPGVQLTLAGPRLYTGLSAADGAYSITGVPAGDYMLTPAKADDVRGITAYDASQALQHAAGLTTLTGTAFTAGDVDKDAAITSMDAFYILQKSVELITVPFPGAGAVWGFAPTSLAFTGLNSNRSGQNFTAVLLGDISGNWGSGGGALAARLGADAAAALSLSEAIIPPGVEVTLDLKLSGAVSGVRGLDLGVTYDPAILQLVRAERGDLPGNWSLAHNTQPSGSVKIGLAGPGAAAGDGTLARLTFKAVGAKGQSSEVAFGSSLLNEGAIAVTTVAGRITIDTPPVTDLRCLKNGNTAQLTWTHVGSDADHYEVWRATNLPYFVPPQGAPIAPIVGPSANPGYDDTYGGLGSPATNNFYLVRSVDAAGRPAPAYNRVGVFNFSLTPGGQ